MSSTTDTPPHVSFGTTELDAAALEAIEHVNDEHSDTVLFLANHLHGREPGSGGNARIVRADASGLAFEIRSGGDLVEVVLDAPAADPEGLQANVYGAIMEARAAVGDRLPLTSLERDFATAPALRTAPGTVVAVRPLTPAMIEVEVAGLEAFEQVAPDTFIFVMVGADGSTIDPSVTIDDWKELSEAGSVIGAYYTVRRRHPETGVVTFWVAQHGHPGGVAGWMAGAEPGAPFVAWGPRPGFVPPADARAILMVADETGFAAAAAVTETLPDDVRVVAFLELPDTSHAPPMPDHPGLAVEWVVRRGEAGTGSELLDAVAALDMGDASGWAAFGGAESRQITRVRRHLRDERGMAADRVLMTGYWRREADAGSPG